MNKGEEGESWKPATIDWWKWGSFRCTTLQAGSRLSFRMRCCAYQRSIDSSTRKGSATRALLRIVADPQINDDQMRGLDAFGGG
jgi:hypothetical protein